MSKRNKGALGSLLVATSCLALTEASSRSVDNSVNNITFDTNGLFNNATTASYLDHNNSTDPSPGSTATPFRDEVPSTAETFGPITSAAIAQTLTEPTASSTPHLTPHDASSAISVPVNHDVAPSSYRITKQRSLVPDNVATRKAGLSFGVGKGGVLECGCYNTRPGWQEVVLGYGGMGGGGKGDADALMKGYRDFNTTSRMPFDSRPDSFAEPFAGWQTSPPSPACPPCPSNSANPLADQLESCLARVETFDFKQQMAEDNNKVETRRLDVWRGQLQEETKHNRREKEELARGWEKLRKQEIDLGVRYRQTLERDPTGLTIYTGPLDASAGRNSTWSWLSTLPRRINYLAISVFLNVVLGLPYLLYIISRLSRRNTPSEHSPASDATTETIIEDISTDLVVVSTGESTISTDLVAVAPTTSTTLVAITSTISTAPVAIATTISTDLVTIAPPRPIISSSTVAIRFTSTAPVTTASPRPIICSGIVVMPSRPTVTMEAESPAVKPMLDTMPNIGWRWIFGTFWQPQQELVTTTVTLIAVPPGAMYDNADAVITEYNVDNDVHLPIVTSQEVPKPCATACGFKIPLQIEGSSSVMLVPLCVQRERTSVNVAPEVGKVLGDVKLGYTASIWPGVIVEWIARKVERMRSILPRPGRLDKPSHERRHIRLTHLDDPG